MNNQIQGQLYSAIRVTVLVIILVVSIGLVGFFLFKNLIDTKLEEGAQSNPTQIQVKDLPKSENPVGMPYNLPIEAGDKVLQNYESTALNGQIQSTRKIYTSASAEQSLAKYSKFFEDLGWKRNITGPKVSPLAYQSPMGALMIVVNPGFNKQGSEVEITILNPIPKQQ